MAALAAAYAAVTEPADATVRRLPELMLVCGEAGIGKTALLAKFAAEVAPAGAQVVWGTCWDADQAPAFWPWTQALRELLEGDGALRAAAGPELAVIVPEPGSVPPASEIRMDEDTARLRIFDAVGRVLDRAANAHPVVCVVDDLQWADPSTVDLLRYLAGRPVPGPLLLVAAYRPDELGTEVRRGIARLSTAHRLQLTGLSPAEVGELVVAIAGSRAAAEFGGLVHRRSDDHPFFARELSQVLASGGGVGGVPTAVREVIARRLARVSTPCARMLEAAAVAGPQLLPDVLAGLTGEESARIAELVAEAAEAGLVSGRGFAHDLYRESIYASLAPRQRMDLHHRAGVALAHRRERGGSVFSAELARHFAAAAPLAGAAPAVDWARRAAEADTVRFAFAEAAGHLARARGAIAEAGIRLPDADLVDLLVAEADARRRTGDAATARDLLDSAWQAAQASEHPARMGAVALGLDQLGARFAMPRIELTRVLDHARGALAGSATTVEARVTAALARQLQHSVAKDRPTSQPLARRAVTIARALDDPGTLAECLLADHDARWTPGTAAERELIATEIAQLAERIGDRERYAQGVLLTATAQLEAGSPVFRATLTEFEHVTSGLRQPRHDYVLRTRQAALALLDGDVDAGERLCAEAAALGAEVGDTDTGNVRMSQRLEIVRARGDAQQLRETAMAAVEWWVGAPAHAHSVAAGFLARAGDLDGARRELDTALALPDLRTDRSYLWSVFVGELATAAIALRDRRLCTDLLDDLLPIADTCAVNGALVCFMGAHAHRVGLLYAAVGQPSTARRWLETALDTHRGLGARLWEAETCAALAELGGEGAQVHATRATALRAALDLSSASGTAASGEPATVVLRRVGDMWQAGIGRRRVFLRDAKGLHDLAVLLDNPGVDIPALELAGSAVGATGAGDRGPRDPVLDRAALIAYRRRLAELDQQLAEADHAQDLSRLQRANDERERLLTELRGATRPDGGSRTLGITAAERARKSVTSRIRDAITRISNVLPELGAHLDQSVRTGTTCSYEPRQRHAGVRPVG